MSLKSIAVAVAVLVLVWIAWLVLSGDGRERAPTAPVDTDTNEPAPPEDSAPDPQLVRDGVVQIHADHWVTGLVVGEGRHPAPGIAVSLVTCADRPLTVRTDAEGRYRLPFWPNPDDRAPFSAVASVRALAPDGRAAVATAYFRRAVDGVLEMPPLALGPAHSLVVRVEDTDGPVADAEVTLTRNVRLALRETNADGTTRFAGIPAGEVLVQARHPEQGRAFARVTFPDQAKPLVLTLSRREITIRTVRAGSGEPVPDIPIRVILLIRSTAGTRVTTYDPPPGVASTDGSGRAVITVGKEDSVRVSADTGAGGENRFELTATVQPGGTEAVLEIPALHTFRWQLVPGEAPPPVEGEILKLLPFTNSGQVPPAETATVVGGQLVIEKVPVDRVNCYALTTDGRIARIYASVKDEKPRDATFRRQRKIEVVVRDESGAPVKGAWIVARDQGNNPMMPPVETNSEGLARIELLHGMLADVSLVPSPGQHWGGLPVGSVDLEKGDGLLEYTLKSKCRATLHVTCDGVKKLPTEFNLVGSASVVQEDPVASTLLVEYDSPGSIWMHARGYRSLNIGLPAAGSAEPIDVALLGGVSVRGFIVGTADGKGGGRVERWDEARARWVEVSLTRGLRFGGRGLTGKIRGEDLAPGRYRMRDRVSGLASVPVSIAVGETGDLGKLDLSRVGAASGVVEVPDGASVAGAQVLVVAEGVDMQAEDFGQRPGAVRSDGRFSVRVPGDRVVMLRVIHPTLRASAEGMVEVREPRDGIVLRLERGPVLRLRGQEPIKSGFGGDPRVLFFKGEPAGSPVFERYAAIVDGGLEFGAPPPGRYTLWLNAAPWAPLVLRDIEVGKESMDLGEREFPVGSALRVVVLVADGAAAPRLGVFAHAEKTPTYSRGLNSRGETEVMLGGLGAGTFKVSASPMMGRRPGDRVWEEIQVDGEPTTVHEIRLDLR